MRDSLAIWQEPRISLRSIRATKSRVPRVPFSQHEVCNRCGGRRMRVPVTKVEAQASGDAFAGAVAGAIADGFAEGGAALITPSGNGVRFNFAAEPDAAGPGGGHVAEHYDPVLAARAGALRDSALV
jgi:hypothetical protein